MTALIVALTLAIFVAFCLAARDAYTQAANQRAVCVACNPTLAAAQFRVRVAINIDAWTTALAGVSASLARMGEQVRVFNDRLQPLVDLPPTDRPSRTTGLYVTAAERWDNWRHRDGSEKYVPKHRAPRGGTH